jgi:amino acid adenylation domain-containing protein
MMVEHNNSSDLLRRLRAGGAQKEPSLRRRPHVTRRPASNALQRLWFLSQLEGEVATYSVPQGFRVVGKLSLERLDDALTSIVARYEAIRTALVQRDGTLWQEVHPPMLVHAKRLEARDMKEAVELANDEAGIPFDLGRPPLLRVICVRVGAEEHLLAFIFHHAAFDAWSLGIFYSELSAFYGGDTYGGAPLAESPLQYGDYSDWQREWLAGPAAQAQRTYWREKLSSPLPVLQLDYASASPTQRTYAGSARNLKLDDALRERITAFAESQGTTVFVVLLSAFLATLHRYSLQDDIVVGVPVACRTFTETEGIIGHVLNTLALRSSIPARLRFSELVEQTSENFFEALANQELPFDQVVNSLEFARETASSPVFQAMLVMQNTPVEAAFRLGGLELESVPLHTGTSKVDVTCSINSTGTAIEVEMEYSAEVFGEAEAARFVDSFINLLSDAVSRPDTRIDTLRMLSAAETESLVSDALERAESYSDFRPLHEYFEQQVRRVPDAVAVEAGGQSTRYAELNERANTLAQHLRRMGAGPESAVVVCLERSIEMLVALLATLKAGTAFVPIDTRYPPERVRAICQDAKPLAVLTREQYRPLFASLAAPLLDVSSLTPAGPAEDPGVKVSPANLAYVYYTSGSTGTPKGVMIDHACMMARLEWLRGRYPLSAGERVLHKTPLIFDVAIWELFLPLMSGATILMADPGAESDVAHIAELLGRRGMVLAHFVPSMLGAYLSYAPRASYPDLKWVALSGEAVSKQLLERFTEHFSAEFHNQYGQTETSEVGVWEGRSNTGHRTVPIGRQVGVYRLHVLDRDLRPMPPGVPGELCVAGEGGLARGYHLRADLTAEKFVPNPYPLTPGERLYRTGDLVRIAESGVIEFLGRTDRQTKVRGCRIETAEVEEVLGRHTAVRSCAVVARLDSSGANQLIAYVVSERPSASELGAHAENFLPSFMLPAAYVFLDDLPLTPSGKLDRYKLPAPSASDFEARGGEQPLQMQLEEQLAALWMQVLGLHKVGRSDNFFAVGGNSIRSIQVLSKIKQTFGVELTVRDFFESPTIGGLAARTERALERLVGSLSESEVARMLEVEGAND